MSPPALGQDSAVSEALFKEGVREMQAGRFERACAALAESHRLEPKAGTLFTLAECEAGWGKLASAVAHYSDYVGVVSRLSSEEKARHQSRVKLARERADAIRPRVPQLTLVLPARVPESVVVQRDGLTLSAAAINIALPADPGVHVITTQVPGGPVRTTEVTLSPGDHKRIVLEVAMPKGDAPTASSEGVRASGQGVPPASEPTGPDRDWAYVAGAVGAAGLVVGAAAGWIAIDRKRVVDDNCSGDTCNGEGKSAADSGKVYGNVSTVGFGVGLVGATAAAVLWLTATPAKTTEARRTLQPILGWGEGSSCFVGVDGAW